MTESFLFVRPPRPQWPFNGVASAVWPPLAFASLAAALRESIRDLRVEILDAPALHMGWRSLAAELHRRKPSYIAIGEEAVSCVEGLRMARLTKDMGARVIAGGCFFSHVPEQATASGLVDIVVHGEAEITITELVQALRSGKCHDLSRVAGISFRSEGEFIRTPPRSLIQDIDRLPMPAYDLLPVACYGRGSRNHPDLAAIELGRGCIGSCSFCVLWRQMGKYQNATLAPHYRVKSPERLLEEVRILTRRFGRKYLGWVDPCFNAHPEVPGQFAELMLSNGIRVGQSAWMRADAIVRDAASGRLRNCVRSGLNEVYLGVERCDSLTLEALHKDIEPHDCRTALRILAQDFPEVFTVGSFIYGLAGDTAQTVRDLHRQALELHLDFPFFIPLTPLPGTPFWKPEMWDPTGERFRSFGFLPDSARRGRQRAFDQSFLLSNLLCWSLSRIRNEWRCLFHRDARKRRLSRRLLLRSTAFEIRQLVRAVVGGNHAGGMVFPKWYEN